MDTKITLATIGIIGTLAIGASYLSDTPVITLQIETLDGNKTAEINKLVKNNSGKKIFCVIKEDTPLRIKRALSGKCTMKIIKDTDIETESVILRGNETLKNTDIKI